MAIDFPSAPTLNQTYTYAGRTWKWNGEGWQLLTNAIGDLILTSDDGGATVGPTATFYRNSATPAASDLIGGLIFQGEDSAGNTQTYAQIAGVIEDPTSTSEDGAIAFYTTSAGTLTERMQVTSTGLSVTGSSIFRAASTQDGIAIVGRAGGTSSYEVSLTPTTLSADQTQTLQNATGTVALSSNKLSFFAATTSAELAGVISDETGSGLLVFATSPTLTTPTLGVASATSINKVAITAPATSATLTIADGKTLTVSNTLTFTGTDSSSVAFGAGGTVAYTANKLSVFAATTSAELAGVISDETGSGSLVFGTSPAITTSLTTGSASFDLINATATTVNFAGAATALTIGATSGTTTVRNKLSRSGNISASSWTTSGISSDSAAGTFTDTSSAAAATVASRVAVSVNTPTFASTNAITVTDAASLYISAAPSAGTGTTITNAYALWVDAGTSRFDGNVMPGADNTLDLGSASLRWANIYTGDLHLKNDRGDYTIIEEEDALTLRNNKTGKVYNFVLQERNV